MEDTFQDVVIDKTTHNENICDYSVILESCSIERSSKLVNSIPKSIIRLEYFYDMHDKFKGFFNCKTNSSSLQFETVNLGTHDQPKTSISV